MCMFNEVIAISQKYWRSYDNYEEELKEACLAFGNLKEITRFVLI